MVWSRLIESATGVSIVNILVTGAAGFIGSHVAERLAGRGHAVVGLDALTDYYDPALKERNIVALRGAGVPVRRLDLATDALDEIVADVEVVFHFAAQPGISATTPFEHYLRNNVVATHRLLEACADRRLACFVNCSTSSVYGAHATDPETAPPKPISYYGVTKLAAEQLVMARWREQRFPACSLRLFSVYGPRERPEKLYPKLIRAILEDRDFPLFAGSLDHSRSFTYVGDVCDAAERLLGHIDRVLGEIVNIGSDREITTRRGIEIVEQIIGRKARLAEHPRRAGDQQRTCADITKARRLLDFEPTTPPEEGLASEVAWMRDLLAAGSP